MQKWSTRIRFDFVEPGTKCCSCPRKLTKGLATVVTNADGKEFYSGPNCAKKSSFNPKDFIPDFTDGCPDDPPEPDENDGAGGNVEEAEEQPEPRRRLSPAMVGARHRDLALQYITLRCKLLQGSLFQSDELDDIWNRLGGRLGDSEAEDIHKVMSRDLERNSRLSLKNLIQCYACQRQLEFLRRRVTKIKEAELLDSFGSYLRTNGKLTWKQMGILREKCRKRGLRVPRQDAFEDAAAY